MAYYLQRRRWRPGPYSLEEVQRLLARGKISFADQVRTDGMSNWMPLGQLLGSLPVSPVSAIQPLGTSAAYPGVQPAEESVAVRTTGPVPPDLHWLVVLLLGWITLGIFTWIWDLIQARFVDKIRPGSKSVVYVFLSLIPAVGIVFYFIGVFGMRDELEEYYNSAEPIDLKLSGVMTFFFNTVYLQYHFYRIAHWKKTGYWPS